MKQTFWVLICLLTLTVTARAQFGGPAVAVRTVTSLSATCQANSQYTQIIELRSGVPANDGFYRCKNDGTGWYGPFATAGATAVAANAIPKSNGTAFVASSATDDGTTFAINTNKFTVTEATGQTVIGTGATTSAVTDLLINPTTKASGNLIDTQVNSVSKFNVTSTGSLTAVNLNSASNIQVADTGSLFWATRAQLASSADGIILMRTAAQTGFKVLTLGAAAPATIGSTASHGQAFSVIQGEELLTIAAAPTSATTMQIPAGAVVLSVSVRVTTVIPTAATFTVTGTSSGTVFNTAAVSTAANTTDVGTKAGAFFNTTAQTITITPNLTPGAATGVVRITCTYYLITPPTS